MEPAAARCPACGAAVAASAAFCSVCGADLRNSVPAPSPRSDPVRPRFGPTERRSAALPLPSVDRRRPDTGDAPVDLVTGVVRGLVQRVEQGWGQSAQADMVCTFRVERHDDEGHPLPVVPVEMRALSFRGAINDGDWVQIEARWQPGETLEPARVHNLTTGGWFQAKGSRRARIVLGLLVFLVIAIAMIVTFVLFMNAMNDVPRPVRLDLSP